jgi:hypothetical protein
VVNWDNKIDNAVVTVNAVEMDAGLDSWFDENDDTVVAVETNTGLDCFNAVMRCSSPIRMILFFSTNLPVVALTGVAWLVVALDIVFVMMGMLWWILLFCVVGLEKKWQCNTRKTVWEEIQLAELSQFIFCAGFN